MMVHVCCIFQSHCVIRSHFAPNLFVSAFLSSLSLSWSLLLRLFHSSFSLTPHVRLFIVYLISHHHMIRNRCEHDDSGLHGSSGSWSYPNGLNLSLSEMPHALYVSPPFTHYEEAVNRTATTPSLRIISTYPRQWVLVLSSFPFAHQQTHGCRPTSVL